MRLTFCGLTITATDERTYGGGHIYPGARAIGRYAKVGRETARKIAKSVGAARPPRPGYEMLICEDSYLVNRAGKFEIERRSSTPFQGRR